MFRFQCSPDFTWEVEPDGVRLTASAEPLSIKLDYPEAALWDFVMRGVTRVRAVHMMMHIGGFADGEATRIFVDRCLELWRRELWIVPR